MKENNHININNFGKSLKIIRKSQKITQEKLAEKTEMQTSYISKIERGDVEPRLGTLLKLRKALDISGSELLGGVDPTLTDKLRIRFEELEKMPEEKQKIIIELMDMSIQNYRIERFANGEITFKEISVKVFAEIGKDIANLFTKK
jgi:transcriptional regulator with XRE-family HTH domain